MKKIKACQWIALAIYLVAILTATIAVMGGTVFQKFCGVSVCFLLTYVYSAFGIFRSIYANIEDNS